MSALDIPQLRNTLQRLEIFFDRDVTLLVKHLEQLVDANQPAEDIHRYAERLLKALRLAQQIEQRQLNEEIRGGRKDLTEEQRHQLTDLEIMERAVKLVFSGNVHQEKTLDERERDFLYSIRDELNKLAKRP